MGALGLEPNGRLIYRICNKSQAKSFLFTGFSEGLAGHFTEVHQGESPERKQIFLTVEL